MVETLFLKISGLQNKSDTFNIIKYYFNVKVTLIKKNSCSKGKSQILLLIHSHIGQLINC